jgi:hypothetical protein
MTTFLYRCPVTGLKVQGWTSDEGSDQHPNTYQSLQCTVCRQIHFIDPRTGKTLAAGTE